MIEEKMTIKTANTTPSSQANTECCMCGDYGLSFQLFRCKLCQFRSQHRYCSNEYPKAESYMVCNWCLTQRLDSVKKALSSPISSSSSKNTSDQEEFKKINKSNKDNNGSQRGKRGNLQLQISKPIKKQRPPEKSPASAGRKRITTIGVLEERQRLRRSKSMDLSKHVFKSKVRRYKLLDEVSSQ